MQTKTNCLPKTHGYYLSNERTKMLDPKAPKISFFCTVKNIYIYMKKQKAKATTVATMTLKENVAKLERPKICPSKVKKIKMNSKGINGSRKVEVLGNEEKGKMVVFCVAVNVPIVALDACLRP